MIKKLVLSTSLAACAIAAAPAFADNKCGNVGVLGDNLSNVDPFFYNGGDAAGTTDSGIPHQPGYYGHMSTNNTYRFFNVNEMVATMVGDGKHGLWRTQDNGTVREYLATGQDGLPAGTDVFSNKKGAQNIIKREYTHLDAAASWAGYRADGNSVNEYGKLNYVDLPINHPKYGGKYDNHEPIDLPSWYCTMSGPEYKYARESIRFAFAQEGANKVGPLGARAGLDVKENYLNVLRLDSFPDGRAWVNTATDTRGANADTQQLDWEAVDLEGQTDYEVYLIERPFFNEEYLFITVVFSDNADGANDTFSYVRPDGAYYDHLVDRGLAGTFRTTLQDAAFDVADDDGNNLGLKAAVPTSLYGVHHPGTGACPAIGGDFGAAYYGGSWPTTYQEVTPLCDAVLVDIKFWVNLDDATWADKGKHLANAGTDSLTKDYTDAPGTYGSFDAQDADPYLAGQDNPEAFEATGTQQKAYQSVRPAVSSNPSLPFEPSL